MWQTYYQEFEDVFTYQTCLCVKWIIKQVKFTGKLLVVFPLQVQRVLIGTESIV